MLKYIFYIKVCKNYIFIKLKKYFCLFCRNSVWSEVLCVTLGTAVIIGSGFAVYRYLKK